MLIMHIIFSALTLKLWLLWITEIIKMLQKHMDQERTKKLLKLA